MLIYFNTSPKYESLLIHIVEQIHFSEERKKVLISVYRTQWSKRDVSYERFYLALPFIVEAFFKLSTVRTQSLMSFKKFIPKGGTPKIKLKLLSS